MLDDKPGYSVMDLSAVPAEITKTYGVLCRGSNNRQHNKRHAY